MNSWLRTRHSLSNAIDQLRGFTGDVWLKIRHIERGEQHPPHLLVMFHGVDLTETGNPFNRKCATFDAVAGSATLSNQTQTASLHGPLRAAAECASQRQRQAFADARRLAETVVAANARLAALQRRHGVVSDCLAAELRASEQRQFQMNATQAALTDCRRAREKRLKLLGDDIEVAADECCSTCTK